MFHPMIPVIPREIVGRSVEDNALRLPTDRTPSGTYLTIRKISRT
jgi:hypothetical protein